MSKSICQSCGMPIDTVEQLGTNKDGSIYRNVFSIWFSSWYD